MRLIGLWQLTHKGLSRRRPPGQTAEIPSRILRDSLDSRKDRDGVRTTLGSVVARLATTSLRPLLNGFPGREAESWCLDKGSQWMRWTGLAARSY